MFNVWFSSSKLIKGRVIKITSLNFIQPEGLSLVVKVLKNGLNENSSQENLYEVTFKIKGAKVTKNKDLKG